MNPDLGEMKAALGRQRRPLPTAADIQDAATLVGRCTFTQP